jgi:hypothetical protein
LLIGAGVLYTINFRDVAISNKKEMFSWTTTARIGPQGHECHDKTARTRLPGQSRTGHQLVKKFI